MDHVSLSVALLWSLFIFSVKYFQWICMCALLPLSPVCPVKSDELENEKQVCVKRADHSFISLSPPDPDLSELLVLNCVL